MARTIIRIWLPKKESSFKNSLGHVSLEIEAEGQSIIYASFWPAYPQILDSIHRITNQILHDLDRPEESARSLIPLHIRKKLGTREQLLELSHVIANDSSSRLENVRPLPMHLLNPEWDMILESSDISNPKETDYIFELNLLDTDRMVEAFRTFVNGDYQWNLLASTFLAQDKNTQNCCGLVLALLEQGGLEEFVEFNFQSIQGGATNRFSSLGGAFVGSIIGRFIYGNTGSTLGMLVAGSASSFFLAKRKPRTRAMACAALSASLAVQLFVILTPYYQKSGEITQILIAIGMVVSEWLGAKFGYYIGMIPEGSGGIVTPAGVLQIAKCAQNGAKYSLEKNQKRAKNMLEKAEKNLTEYDVEIGMLFTPLIKQTEELLKLAKEITSNEIAPTMFMPRFDINGLLSFVPSLPKCTTDTNNCVTLLIQDALKESTPSAQLEKLTFGLIVTAGYILKQLEEQRSLLHDTPLHHKRTCTIM